MNALTFAVTAVLTLATLSAIVSLVVVPIMV